MSEDVGTRAPCGCVFGVKGDAFVMEPCSPTCDTYAYAIEQTRKQGKPIRTVDLRKAGQLPFSALCPYCGKKNDGFSGPDEPPKPGDRSLCAYCARIGVYTGHGIRKPTPEEDAKHADDPGLRVLQQAVRDAIRKRN